MKTTTNLDTATRNATVHNTFASLEDACRRGYVPTLSLRGRDGRSKAARAIRTLQCALDQRDLRYWAG